MINYYESGNSSLLNIQLKTYDKQQNENYHYVSASSGSQYKVISNNAYTVIKVEVSNFLECQYINKVLVSLPIEYNASKYTASIYGVESMSTAKRSQIDALFNSNNDGLISEILNYKTELHIDVATKKFAGSPNALNVYHNSNVTLDITSYYEKNESVSEYYIIEYSFANEKNLRLYDNLDNYSYLVISVNDKNVYNPFQKQLDLSFDSLSNISLNLYSGVLFTSFAHFTSLSKRIPITYNFTSNFQKDSSASLFLQPNIMNFYNNGDDFILHDNVNATKTYTVEYVKYMEFNGYNISSLVSSDIIYYCYFDNSYFYIFEEDEQNYLWLFTKNNTNYKYLINSNQLYLSQVSTNDGKYITYEYSDGELSSITNSDNETITITRVGSALVFVLSNSNKRMQVFNNDTSIVINYLNANNIIDCLHINFDDNKNITSIDNALSKNRVAFTYSNDKITSATYELYDGSSSIITERLEISYFATYSIVKNRRNEKMYYFFESNGICTLELSDKGNAISYNYQENYGKEMNKIKNYSAVQCVSDNKLVHSTFTKLDDWEFLGFNNSTYDIDSNDLGNKCLKITHYPNETLKIKQSLDNTSGTYYLGGRIKHKGINPQNLDISLVVSGSKITGYTNDENGLLQPILENVTEKYHANIQFDRFGWYTFDSYALKIYFETINSFEYVVEITGDESNIWLENLYVSNSPINRYNYVENGKFEKVYNNRPIEFEWENLSSEDVVEMHNEETSLVPMDVLSFLGPRIFVITGDSSEAIKKVYQTINFESKDLDDIFFSVFAVGNCSENDIFRAYVIVDYLNTDEVKYTSDFQKNAQDLQNVTIRVKPIDEYVSIRVGIEVQALNDVYLYSMALHLNNDFREFTYDQNGNVLSCTDPNNIQSMKYNNDNQTEKYIDDTNGFTFTYNQGLLESVTDVNNNKVTYEYTDGLLTKYTIISADNITWSEEYTYDALGYIDTIKDIQNNNTKYIYDSDKRLKEIKLNNITIKKYSYDNYDNVNKVEEGNYSNLITSDSQKIVSMSTPLRNNYVYHYDTYNRMTGLSYNDLKLIDYDYNIYSDLRKKIYSNNSVYTFDYDSVGRIKNVKYNNEIIAEMEYDVNGNLVSKIEGSNYREKYVYEESKLSEIRQRDFTVNYNYDNLGNVHKKNYYYGKTISYDYRHDYEKNEYSINNYIKYIKDRYKDELIIASENAKGYNGATPVYKSFVLNDEDNIKSFKFSANNYILYDTALMNKNNSGYYENNKSFKYGEWANDFVLNKTYYLWLKLDGNVTSQELISLYECVYEESDPNDFGIYNPGGISRYIVGQLRLMADGKVGYVENNETIYQSVNSIASNSWNFICLHTYTENNISKAEISVNGVWDSAPSFTLNNSISDVESVRIAGEASSTSQLLIPVIGIGAYSYTHEILTTMYTKGNDLLNQNDNVSAYSGVSYYNPNVYSGLDVITLNGTFTSTQGLAPAELEGYDVDAKELFHYKADEERYVLLFNDEKRKLAYDLNLTTVGTVTCRFTFDSSITNNKFIIYGKEEDSNETLEIRMYGTNYIRVKAYDNVSSEYISVTSNQPVSGSGWHTLALTFMPNSLKVYIDGILYNSIAASVNTSNYRWYFGGTKSGNLPLSGYLEMISFGDIVLSEDRINCIHQKGKLYNINTFKNSLGMPIKRNIANAQTIEYAYDKNIIVSESVGTTVRNYLYDERSNVSRLTVKENNVVVKSHEYIYNLSNAICMINETDVFNYDSNGNISFISKNGKSISFKYDSTIRDLLISKTEGTNETILFVYNGINKYYPSEMNVNGAMKSLTWEGKRLTNIGNNIAYKYNSDGLRIEKIVDDTITSYEYEAGKLVRMSIDNEVSSIHKELIFNYDEQGMIIGFSIGYDDYFYIRDILGNINKIIDINGNDIVKFDYSIYGKPTKTVIVNCDASIYNPFMYKGYYYDEETQLFYCNSRYYSPELCRFISPDDVEYLDPESVNGLNLYCYCLNNPISYADPSGHFVITTAALLALGKAMLIGGLIAAGTAYGVDVVTNFSDGFELSDFDTFTKENLIKYAYAFAGGAISGALGSFNNTGLQLLGTFVGEMVENTYSFTSWENVGQALIMSVFSTTLDGVLTVGKNRLTRSYFQKGRSNLSTKANKQIKKFLNKGIDPTNVHASDLINRTYKYYNRLDNITGSIHWLLTL